MSADDLHTDLDPAIRVHVSPSQASYFAGEPFSVTITFTNTRTPESPKAKQSHRRNVHSVSSAPLARPPTSPGIVRTTALPPVSAPVANTNSRDIPARKRLIGQVSGKVDMSTILEQKRQSLLEKSRSLSIDIPAGELFQNKCDSAGESASRYVRAYNEFSDAGLPANAPPPSTRSPDFQLPPHHPHARKQSVADVHIHINEAQPPSSGLASASTSTFSLALDPIAETPSTSYPSTPLPRTPSLTSLDQRSHETIAEVLSHRPAASRRPAQLGLGPPPTHPHRNGTLVSSNSELILYSYAQLLGNVSITPLPGVVMAPEQAQRLSSLRLKLLKRAVVGGGCMDITSHQWVQERRRSHSRSTSLTSSLFSLLSPSTFSAPSTPLPSSQSWAAGRPHTPSGPASTGNGAVGLGLHNGGTEEDIDPDAPLPTLDVQPAMLAVDLMLAPGESRTYTYTVLIPDNLPPTFRGRALRFSYELVIGTCRASASAMRSSSSLGPTGANSISRVMKVPIRVYNHVAVGKVIGPYDLLWPVGRRTCSVETAPKVTEGAPKKASTADNAGPLRASNVDELREYGRRLLATFGEGAGVLHGEEGEDPAGGCREAVEMLTRNPKKVSYDVSKQGIQVAVLTFTKSGYRLGETVLGVVELNERKARSRVLSLSAVLESQESLPSQLASAAHLRHMRRVHAEHHASLLSSALRTTFALDIPSDASPAFQVRLPDPASSAGGLVWRVRLSLLVAVAAESSLAGADGVRLRQFAQDGAAGEWGTAYRAYPTIAPKERPSGEVPAAPSTWAQFLVSSLLGMGEREHHDGDGDEEEEEEEEEEETVPQAADEWRDVRVETVECEVPINVWPGNTAFKAMDVVFDV